GLDAVDEHRAVIAAAHVVLAGPDRLHRRAGRLGDLHRLGDVVGAAGEATAEPAAEERRVQRHLLDVEAEELRRDLLVARLPLRAGPDLALPGVDLRRRVERLHAGVREVRHLVARLDALGGAGERLRDVAGLRHRRARPGGQRAELREILVAVEVRA